MMKMHVNRKLGVVATIALSAGIALTSPAAQADVDFKGKKIEIVVPFREGGGADVYARLYSPYLAKLLPGSPAIVIVNIPGGASIRGTNQFEQKAKPDGLTMLSISTSTFVSYLFGGKKVKYDMSAWRPIVMSPLGSVFYAAKSTGVTGKDIIADVKKLQKTNLVFGAKNVIAGELRAMLSYELLGMNVKTVFGMERGPSRKAMLRGEFNINYDSMGAYMKNATRLIDKGVAVPLFTLGFMQKGGKVVADPIMPKLPHVAEIYEKLWGKKPEGVVWQAWKNFLYVGVMTSKGFVLPKGTPDNILNAYIKTVKDLEKDPTFIKRSRKLLGDYPQSYGEDAAEVIKEGISVTPEVRAWLKTWVKKNYNYNM
ncbi:MAG: hypothetical protein RIB59_04865 [Rhodospirillales bacterium]